MNLVEIIRAKLLATVAAGGPGSGPRSGESHPHIGHPEASAEATQYHGEAVDAKSGHKVIVNALPGRGRFFVEHYPPPGLSHIAFERKLSLLKRRVGVEIAHSGIRGKVSLQFPEKSKATGKETSQITPQVLANYLNKP